MLVESVREEQASKVQKLQVGLAARWNGISAG